MQNRPAHGGNNVWYEYSDAETVFVFVHGIFSDSRDAWFHEDRSDPGNGQYWPELIRADPNFGKVSIFLGGFYTKITSGDYDIRDAANELYGALAISVDPAPEAVLDKRNIVFITHSTGGIVVRHMLVRHASDFRNKNVGLALIASPSVGSRDASRLNWLAEFAKQKLGQQLQWNHPFLEELDKDFKNLVDQREIPGLVGAEAIENHFIIKWLRVIDKKVLVESSSAGRYFGEPIRLANTDHFSAVKPDSRQHPAYRFLRNFYEKKFQPMVETRAPAPSASETHAAKSGMGAPIVPLQEPIKSIPVAVGSPMADQLRVSRILQGNSDQLARCLFDIQLENLSGKQATLDEYRITWKYCAGVLASISRAELLEPVSDQAIYLDIDPTNLKEQTQSQPVYPSVVIPSGNPMNPSVGLLRLELIYRFTGKIEHHPTADWNISYSLSVRTTDGDEIPIFIDKLWRD